VKESDTNIFPQTSRAYCLAT